MASVLTDLFRRVRAATPTRNWLVNDASAIVLAANAARVLADKDGNIIWNADAPASRTSNLTAASTLTARDSGRTLFLNSATEFVTTLPLPAAGLNFDIIVTAAPSGASYTIVTNASANIIKGNIVTSATGAADTETSGGDTISFVDGTAVAGDRVQLRCDGTTWFAYGQCAVATAITITTAS